MRLGRDYWYPIALSKQLKPGRMVTAQFSADSIVIVRTSAGKLFALEDRCAHRQVPLSLGSVVGESLRCSYHGRCFGADGQCSSESLEKLEARLPSVRAYPVKEHAGLIFVFPGDPTQQHVTPMPSLSEAHSHAYLSIPFQREVRCHYSFLHENLIDMSHQVLHRRWTGNFRPKLLRTRSDGNSVEAVYSADLQGGSRLLRLLPGAVIRLQHPKAPGRKESAQNEATISTDYPYQSLVLRTSGVREPIIRLWNAYIPVGEREDVTRPVGLLLVRRPIVPGLLSALKPILLGIALRIFEEDRKMMELEQRAYDLQGSDQTREEAPFLLDLRQLLRDRGLG